MGIIWFDQESKDVVATINKSSITLNKVGTKYFETAYQVMIGYDEENRKILIKPLSKTEIERGDISEFALYNISISSTYARVTNKAFIEKIEETFNKDFTDKGKKYRGQWITTTETLEITLKEVE